MSNPNAVNKNGSLFSLIMSSWGSGGPETRKRLVTAFSQNDHFTLKVGLPRNSQYVDFACNPEGDTLLHLATRRSNEKSVKMLLRIGADPNARNKLGRTPLHEAAMEGNLKNLQMLVDYGGDLRLHDAYHQTPRQLTAALGQEKKMDIAYYIEVMRFLSTCYNSYETEVMVTHRKLKDMKKSQNSRAPSAPLPEINCLGFGVFCTEKDKTSLISCIPFVRERDLIMMFNRYPYVNGPFTSMSTMTHDKNAVTVRKLRVEHNPKAVDLLIMECTQQRHLRHPGLLFLMSVFNSARLDSIGLVFEHVTIGSLYSVLHTERMILPPKKISYILCQICEALMYIHKQHMVHNSLSSYAIQLVNEKTAKLTNFEFMNYALDTPNNWLILREERSLKNSVWRWSSPELLEERIPSFKSDLFSFCAVIWEMYHRIVPWKESTQHDVKEKYRNGETFVISSPGVTKTLMMQLELGLCPNETHRVIELEELRMTFIKESVKTFVERGTDPAVPPLPGETVNTYIGFIRKMPSLLMPEVEEVSESKTSVASNCMAMMPYEPPRPFTRMEGPEFGDQFNNLEEDENVIQDLDDEWRDGRPSVSGTSFKEEELGSGEQTPVRKQEEWALDDLAAQSTETKEIYRKLSIDVAHERALFSSLEEKESLLKESNIGKRRGSVRELIKVFENN